MDHTNINHSIEQYQQQFPNKLTPSQESADHIKRPISSYASISDTDNAFITENPINTSTTPTKTQNHQTNNSILTTKLLESQSNRKKANAGITHNTPRHQLIAQK
ncbi:unnamed protein product [Macrosiphum euphorbiae]|uniref:Uncharacterized protein n=1 Tax=Macrosiphum euphorbiae TaxID=13131 RepID=A0AAV0Y0H6_9HEMI|nr:unnamed protein product [Macrosiphum euphorbiae]